MALISDNYYKIDFDKCKLENGILSIAYNLYSDVNERNREKDLDFKPFTFTYLEKQLNSYATKTEFTDKDYSDADKICKQIQVRKVINSFFENRMYLKNNINYDKDFYRNLFNSFPETSKYVEYIDNPINNTGSGIIMVENYIGNFDIEGLYGELKRHLHKPKDDL